MIRLGAIKLAATVATIAVLPMVTAARCTSSATFKDCSFSFSGEKIERGLVVDTVTATCTVRPQEHLLRAQLELHAGDWVPQGRYVARGGAPGPDTGVSVRVTAPCLEGTWRTTAYAQGTSPDGTPFTYQEHGPERHFALVECAR